MCDKPEEKPNRNLCGSLVELCQEPPTLTEGMLIGVCNPLLDILTADGRKLLHKYKLSLNAAVLVNRRTAQLYRDLDNLSDVKYVAGGAVHNTARVFQWIIKKPFVSVYFGCVGDDEYAERLEERARLDGVNVRLQRTKHRPTGRCAVLISGQNRTLVADLGAATHLTVSHLRKYTNRKLLENAKFYYTSGFMLASNPQCVMELAHWAHKLSRTFIFSMGSRFSIEEYMDEIKSILLYVDVLLGDEMETLALATAYGWDTRLNMKVIAQRLFLLPKKNPKRQRIVVITRGTQPVVVVQEDSVREYPVHPVPHDLIIDTNGAGDAFMGGFLSQFVQGKEMSVCIMWAMWAASVIIRNWGCSFEGKPIMERAWLEQYMAYYDGTAAGQYSHPIRQKLAPRKSTFNNKK